MARLTPENYPIITALPPCAGDTTGDSADAINTEGCNGVLVIFQHAGTNDNDITLTIHEGASAAEAAAGTYAVAATFPIWAVTGAATSDVPTRQTDAASYVIDSNGGGTYLICMYIPTSILTAGRPWIQLGNDAGHASNFISAIYILDGARYQQSTPLTAIA